MELEKLIIIPTTKNLIQMWIEFLFFFFFSLEKFTGDEESV